MLCEFCDRTFHGDLVFEDDDALVILHEDWAVRGHGMVVSKRHVQNASELAEGDWQRLAAVYRRAETALLELTGAERAIMMKLGIAVPHLHIHIYPMSASDDRAAVMRAINGETREAYDPAFVEAVRIALKSGGRAAAGRG